MSRVLTICPETGETVATHAILSAKQLRHLRLGLALFCEACCKTHIPDRSALWLEPTASDDCTTGVEEFTVLRVRRTSTAS